MKPSKTKHPYQGLYSQPVSSEVAFLSSYPTVDTLALSPQSHFLLGTCVLLFLLPFVRWPQISVWLMPACLFDLPTDVALAEPESVLRTSFLRNSVTLTSLSCFILLPSTYHYLKLSYLLPVPPLRLQPPEGQNLILYDQHIYFCLCKDRKISFAFTSIPALEVLHIHFLILSS